MLGSHLLTLILFSGLVSIFFAALSRENFKDGLRLGALMMGLMVGIALAVAWVMYIFPAS
jgi:hypothetical protein